MYVHYKVNELKTDQCSYVAKSNHKEKCSNKIKIHININHHKFM